MMVSISLTLAGCGGAGSSPVPATHYPHDPVEYVHTTARVASAGAVPCSPAAIHHGAPLPGPPPPGQIRARGSPCPTRSRPGNAAAPFFFAPTLRAGHPTNPANTVLWVVRFPRDGGHTARASTSESSPPLDRRTLSEIFCISGVREGNVGAVTGTVSLAVA